MPIKPKIELLQTDPISCDRRDTWLTQTVSHIGNRFVAKYLRGAIEHNGDIGEVPVLVLLDELEAEHLDALAYIAEIRRRVRASKSDDIYWCQVCSLKRVTRNGEACMSCQSIAKSSVTHEKS